MGFDSIANASFPTAVSNSKEFGKKKRVNRTAKLKQSKLDVRREQWLSQVKNRVLGFKDERNVSGGMKVSVVTETSAVNNESEGELRMVKLEISVGAEENEGVANCYSDSESPSNSPTNFTGSSSRSSSGSSSGSSSSRSDGCFSRSVTDEDDRDDDEEDDCLDDWETMADALAADDVQKNHNDNIDNKLESRGDEIARETESVENKITGQESRQASNNFRAWRPDDVSRPQCLPNLLKQNSFPMQSGLQSLHHGLRYAPSSCPICCEDLDMTDSSFLPCPCGYRLCLFCHKRILEDDGRCPGCRKQYEYDQTDHKTTPFKLARCYSVNPMH